MFGAFYVSASAVPNHHSDIRGLKSCERTLRSLPKKAMKDEGLGWSSQLRSSGALWEKKAIFPMAEHHMGFIDVT